jgi:hypothetical protein
MIKEVVLAQKIVRLHAAAGRPARPASGGAAPNSQPAGAETLGQTQTCWGQTPRSRVDDPSGLTERRADAAYLYVYR